jgi:hypothetical protein
MECVIFSCAHCGLPLTEPLSSLPDLSSLSEEDGKDHLPAGYYLVAPPPDEEGGYYTEATGQYLVNRKDVRNTKYHPNRGRLNGCCGLDGCDGKNLVCLNGHEVATERSDCWMAHSTTLDPVAVTIATVTG